MPQPLLVNRRSILKASAGAGSLLLAGCNRATESKSGQGVFRKAEALNKTVQQAVTRQALATEFREGDLSPEFKANGTFNPSSPSYKAWVAAGFDDWRLKVDGLVGQPLTLTLADLRDFPARTQITRHDCVEGWSCIGKWTGARLSAVLQKAGLKPDAKYLVFHCADTLGGGLNGAMPYYESIDLDDAFHEQTILAYGMNGRALPVAYGAPLRLRVERQLGYKHAKYLTGIEAVSSLDGFGNGHGSYWADRGYAWYAGI